MRCYTIYSDPKTWRTSLVSDLYTCAGLEFCILIMELLTADDFELVTPDGPLPGPTISSIEKSDIVVCVGWGDERPEVRDHMLRLMAVDGKTLIRVIFTHR